MAVSMPGAWERHTRSYAAAWPTPWAVWPLVLHMAMGASVARCCACTLSFMVRMVHAGSAFKLHALGPYYFQ